MRPQEVFFCTECGYESKKWMGQCPGCKSWNTFTEEPRTVSASVKGTGKRSEKPENPVKLKDIHSEDEPRFDTGFEEFSRVLGGGIVPGSVVLIGGDPGIGKSTLLLQTAFHVADNGKKVIYVSGEESLTQIKLRAQRTGSTDGDLSFLSSVNIDPVIELISRETPDLCIIDSIQTMLADDIQSAAGSVSQVRECAQRLTICAKSNGISIFVVGHVTKEGTVAGPRVLEHIVDTVVYFESSDQGLYRILRSTKNRFGSTNEIGVFEMGGDGLHEVPDPSRYMLEGRPEKATGAVVTCLMEGTRPMMLEVQGLITETQYNIPRRQALGMDYNRLNLLMAVLEKRGGLKCGTYDAYINITGGMHITEPAADLAVLTAIISSFKNIVIPSDTCVFGEVGLSGEIRNIPFPSERVKEAKKLGFTRVILPSLCLKSLKPADIQDMEIQGIRYISELYALI